MPRAFISYSTAPEDKEPVEMLRNSLRNFGDDVFFAGDSLPAGVDFWPHIINKISEAGVFIVLATKASCASKSVAKEIDEALRMKKEIIPLLCGISGYELPEKIRHLHALDINDKEQLNRFLRDYGQKTNNSNAWTYFLLGAAASALAFYIFLQKNKK